MSYPFVGIQGVWPEYEKWDAAAIERALRDGHPIYLGQGFEAEVVSFERGKFRITGQFGDPDVYENEDFAEFMAHVLFFGQDIL